MQVVKRSWYGQLCDLFGSHAKTLAVTAEGMQLSVANGAQLFSWSQLNHPPAYSEGWLGCTIAFTVEGKEFKHYHLSYAAKQDFAAHTTMFWVDTHQEELVVLLDKIDDFLKRRYLRLSYQHSIKQSAIGLCKRWLPWGHTAELSHEVRHRLDKLISISKWKAQCISDIQAAYVAEQLHRYQNLFDTVESNPLTQKQREACVIDDDNNLLLAGAGTGKTSVMVGRSGYLLASNQALTGDVLLLAYGAKAAEEMDQRIKQKLENNQIKASTFHSLGMRVISAVEGAKPSLSPWVNDEKGKEKWVHERLELLLLEDDYRYKILEYFSKYYYVEKHDYEFDSMGDYLDYLSANDIRSLKGDLVKSFGELYIANWLFGMGIEYQYEARYQHKVSSLDFRQYEPDFYLPEYGIYIEYYGVDEQGNTAPYIDSEEYRASMEWKRSIHQQHETTLFEFFYYQHRDGQLLALLEQQLTSLDVKTVPLPDEAMLATLNELGRVTELAKLFANLISLYKAACLNEQGLEKVIANSADAKQTAKAFELLQPVLEQYQQLLIDNDYIDFEDMIAKALAYIEQGKFRSPWRYIMVDEFQDISEPRARLVRALRDSRMGTSLFCVGDDWQAIYRFSGADVGLTTGFANYFGASTTCVLDQTFRFNNSIGDIASEFVTKNPVQLEKIITSQNIVTQAAVSILRASEDRDLETGPLRRALLAISERAQANATVYVLARFWFHLPDRREEQQLNLMFPNLQIKSLSIHASKGKEADYVVLMGMTKGKHGFPSAKATPPLLDALLPALEDYDYAEERRLFYVALTRARHRVYVVADYNGCSEFVTELLEKQYDVEVDEFESSFVQRLMNDIKCMRCNTGALVERSGKFGLFYGCSNYPRCKHAEKGCSHCDAAMTREQRSGFKVCLDDICENVIPLCDICGAEMALRKGPRGEFWGCRNYRGKETPSCSNTKQQHQIVLEEVVSH